MKTNVIDVNIINELTLFVLVIIWYSDIKSFGNQEIYDVHHIYDY